jgi:hypothetical protein
MRGGTPSGALQEWLAFAISVRGEDDGTKLRSAVQSNPSDATTIDASNRP